MAHIPTYSDSKYLAKSTISDKIFKDRAYEIPRNWNYDGNQRPLESMVYKFFDTKTGSGISVNQEPGEEIQKKKSLCQI